MKKQNNEVIKIQGLGSWIQLVYPEKMDLTSQETITIRYLMATPSNSKKIRLNPDSNSDLECEDLSGFKKCIVPLSHFEDKETGYYQNGK